MQDALLQAAKDAISACFDDTSVSSSHTRQRMEELQVMIEENIEALPAED